MGETGGEEELKSPQGKQSERPSSSKTPQASKTERHTGGTKRKLGSSGTNSEDEGDKRTASAVTPKRRRSQAGEGSPTPGPATPRTPNTMQRHTMPISERQQMSLLKQMTAESSQGESSPRPSSPEVPGSSVKKTPTAKVNKRNERGETRLHIASIRGDDKETKRLIKAGADVNVEDYAGWTPLHEACNRGWVAVAKQLLKAGANVNVQGMDNDTPLHDASTNGHYKLVQMLLRHGANPLQTNSQGKTPLDMAQNDEIRHLLKNEIIASTSSSSSQDDARSPTSPESALLSDKEDDHKHDSMDSGVMSSPSSAVSSKGENVTSSTGSPHASLGSSGTAAVSSSVQGGPGTTPLRPGKHHLLGGNGNSKVNKELLLGDTPRLMLKFHKAKDGSNIIPEAVPRSRSSHYTPYSVTMKEEDKLPYAMSPQFSESSQDSDMYNPQLGISYIEKKLADSESNVDSSQSVPVLPKMYSGLPESYKGSSVDSTSHDKDRLSWNSVGSSTSQRDCNVAAPSSTECRKGHEDPMEVDSSISSSSSAPMGPHGPTSTSHNIPQSSPSSSSHSGILRRPVSSGILSKITDSESKLPSSSSIFHHHHKDSPEEAAKRAEIQKSKESQALHVYAFDDEDDNMPNRELKISPKFEREKDKEKEREKELEKERDREKEKENNATKHSPKSEKDSLRLSPKTDRDSRSPKSDNKERGSPKSENRIFTSKGERQSQVRADRESRHSPKTDNKDGKTSPPKTDREHRHSPKLDKDAKNTNKDLKVTDVNRASPKPDRDSRSPKSDSSRESRPSSPKVPPLRIILPTKPNNGNNHESEKQKSTTSKHALPYIFNPNREGEASSSMDEGEGATQPTSNSQDTSTVTTTTTTNPDDKDNSTQPTPSSTTQTSTTHLASSSPTPCTSTVPQDSIARRTRNKERQSEQEKEKEKEKDGMERDDGDSRHSSTDGKKEGEEHPGERRMTRSQFRTQQQQKGDHNDGNTEKETGGSGSSSSSSNNNSTSNNGRGQQEQDYSHMHPRTRKLRRPEPPPPQPPAPHHNEKPDNPYEMYLNIRKKIASRWQHWEVVQPKAPQGFKDYLLVNANYVLEGNTASRLAAPMLSPPNSVTGPMRDLFMEHEKRRYKLRLQHVIEREKLMLSIEQEILRVHGRAARALANQGTPLSFCTILKDENIYTPVDGDQDEKEKNSRTRYNGRQFLSWLQDVGDKFEKIKEALLLRHHHEAESLHAVQKLEWEWKLKEAGLCDYKSTPVIDDIHVPMVQVNDEFDLLPA